jgi:putative DNA primase/helicase
MGRIHNGGGGGNTAADIAAALGNAKRSGKDWLCSCPVPSHGKGRGDKDPSLAIADKAGGGVLWRCRTGCTQDEVAAELRARGLIGGGKGAAKMPAARRSNGAATPAPAAKAPPAPPVDLPRPAPLPTYTHETRYVYRNADGHAVAIADRYRGGPDSPKPKDFRPWGLIGASWAMTKLAPEHMPVYNLPGVRRAIAAGDLVYLTEGEKCASALAAALTAAGLSGAVTATISGSSHWHKVYALQLAGARLCILPDNDGPGTKYATAAAGDMRGACILWPPDWPPPALETAGDVADWLDAGGDVRALVSACEALKPSPVEPATPRAGEVGTDPAITLCTDDGAALDDDDGAELWAALRPICERARGPLDDEAWARLRDDLHVETEHGRRIARALAGRYIFAAPAVGWLQWSGVCWRLADLRTLRNDAESAAGELRELLAAANDAAKAKGATAAQAVRDRLRRAYNRAQSKAGLDAAIDLAAGEPSIRVDDAALDAHPHLLATPAGTVDLRAATMRPNDPADYMTRAAAVAPAAEEPKRWLATLRAAFAHYRDPEAMLEHARRWLGYCLTGETREEAFVWFWSRHGRGGKGTITEAFAAAAGDYADRAPKGRFNPAREEHPTVNMDRRGKRFTYESEPARNRPLSTAVLKAYTGGDKEKGRMMRADYAAGFVPTDKLLIQANHAPNPDDPTDDAFWARILPWYAGTAYRRPDDPDAPEGAREVKTDHKAAILRDPTELGRILNWAIGGAAAWYAGGLAIPAAVYADRRALCSEVDPIGAFVRERTAAVRGAVIGASTLGDAFNEWALANDADPMTPPYRALALTLKARGWASTRKSGGNFWIGRQLLAPIDYDANERVGYESEGGAIAPETGPKPAPAAAANPLRGLGEARANSSTPNERVGCVPCVGYLHPSASRAELPQIAPSEGSDRTKVDPKPSRIETNPPIYHTQHTQPTRSFASEPFSGSAAGAPSEAKPGETEQSQGLGYPTRSFAPEQSARVYEAGSSGAAATGPAGGNLAPPSADVAAIPPSGNGLAATGPAGGDEWDFPFTEVDDGEEYDTEDVPLWEGETR